MTEADSALTHLFEMADMTPEDRAGLDIHIHAQCQSYDDGHRKALLDQLIALEKLAARQAERSAATAQGGDNYDRRCHQWVQQVAMVLRTLRQASMQR
jgi:hypothetical protein